MVIIKLDKLDKLEAGDIISRITFDEVPEGYRGEVWVDEDNGDNWFVGSAGAISYNSGMVLTPEKWNDII